MRPLHLQLIDDVAIPSSGGGHAGLFLRQPEGTYKEVLAFSRPDDADAPTVLTQRRHLCQALPDCVLNEAHCTMPGIRPSLRGKGLENTIEQVHGDSQFSLSLENEKLAERALEQLLDLLEAGSIGEDVVDAVMNTLIPQLTEAKTKYWIDVLSHLDRPDLKGSASTAPTPDAPGRTRSTAPTQDAPGLMTRPLIFRCSRRCSRAAL